MSKTEFVCVRGGAVIAFSPEIEKITTQLRQVGTHTHLLPPCIDFAFDRLKNQGVQRNTYQGVTEMHIRKGTMKQTSGGYRNEKADRQTDENTFRGGFNLKIFVNCCKI